MNEVKVSLARHLSGFSAVNLGARVAASSLKEWLQRFGPVSESAFAHFSDGLSYLLPLKSFTTRYLVVEVGQWSILLTDMKEANCYVEAYVISRATLCRAIGLFLNEDRRELHVFENGEELREVQSLRDGNRWYFREEGALQAFEDVQEVSRRRKQDRLRVEALQRYFRIFTGMDLPDWKLTCFTDVFGLERSTHEGRVPIIQFETVRDL